MKKLLFATLLSLAFTAYAFAGSGIQKNAQLLKDLTTALNTANTTTYKTTDVFRSISFQYNNMTGIAFYSTADNSLLGFTVPIITTNLPAGTQENIQKKFNGRQVEEAMMFIGSNGATTYYVSAIKAKRPALVLRLSASGKPSIYSTM